KNRSKKNFDLLRYTHGQVIEWNDIRQKWNRSRLSSGTNTLGESSWGNKHLFLFSGSSSRIPSAYKSTHSAFFIRLFASISDLSAWSSRIATTTYATRT